MAQPALLPSAIARRPSLTATVTRDRRRRARLWATGLERWDASTDQCKSCDASIGGAHVPTHTGILRLCWDCMPVEGVEPCNWEFWCPTGMGLEEQPCARCGAPVGGPNHGGCFGRGGPFCWGCGSPSLEEQREWHLALRKNPHLAPPWARDRMPPFVAWPSVPAECIPCLLPPDPAPCPECAAPGGERCPESCLIVQAVRECERWACAKKADWRRCR